MAQPIDKKELWVGWTRDAMSKYIPPDGKIDTKELVEDMVETTVGYANAMLEEFEDHFEGGRARGRRRKPDDDEED
jgi:hypothetical protein